MGETTHGADKAATAINSAIMRGFLLEDSPARVFFASLVTKHKYEPAPAGSPINTAATNGKTVFYDRDFINQLPFAELVGVLAHEALHPGFGHHARRGNRDPVLWNTAADLVINQVLLEAGYSLPAGAFLPGRGPHASLPRGLVEEQYYDILAGHRQEDEHGKPEPKPKPTNSPEEGENTQDEDRSSGMDEDNTEETEENEEDQPGKDDQPGAGDQDGEESDGADDAGDEDQPQNDGDQPSEPVQQQGGHDPGGCGEVMDGGDEAAQSDSEADWQVAVAQAVSQAEQRGELPGGLARLVNRLLHPKVSWKDVLEDFLVRSFCRDDYSWGRPNRRYISQGVYLPSLIGEELPEVVVAIDTSGSIGQPQLDSFAEELNGILDANPAKVTVVYCDAAIQGVEVFERDEGPVTLQPKGGGGTSHEPVWKWLEDYVSKDDGDPACVVCLTDGYTSHGTDPGIPVLWVITEGGNQHVPFGRAVEM